MIKNLSDIRRLRRVGKIHLGVKATAKSGSEYPKAVDYFVVKADESTPASAAEAFKAIYGTAPKEIEIMFPVNAVNVFWDCFYKSYVRTATGGKLICKGDGVCANRLNIETGELMEIPCPSPEDCEYSLDKDQKPTKCRRVGTLQFLIPKVGILGVWQIDTGSFNGIVGLNSDIDMIRTVTGGRIAMIPLVLKVVPKKCTHEGKQTIIHHLTAEYRGTMATLQALSEKMAKQRLSYQVEPVNPDEIPADLMPPETLPQIGHDAAAEPKQDPPAAPAEQQAPAEKQEAPSGIVADLTQHELVILADKGMSAVAGKELKAMFDNSVDFLKHLATLPGRKPAPAAASAPAAKKPEPAVDLTTQLTAEFERLKCSQAKRDGLMRSYVDKAKLLKILKESK